jgi:protein TonB
VLSIWKLFLVGICLTSSFNSDMKKFLLALSLLSAVGVANAAEVAPVVEKQTCEKAVYPKSALMNEETGTVMLSVLVGPDGSVVDSKVDQSSGSKTLDKAAVKIYSSCKFKPSLKDGKPQQAWAKLEHIWSLS